MSRLVYFICYRPPSSSGPGHRPFKAATRVRFPLGVPEIASPDTCGYLGFLLPCAGNRTPLGERASSKRGAFAASARGRLRPSEGGRRRGARRFPLGVPQNPQAQARFLGPGPFSAPSRRSNPVGGASVGRGGQLPHKEHAQTTKLEGAIFRLDGEKITDPNAVGRIEVDPSDALL